MPLRIASAERGGTFWTQAMALKTILEREPELAPVEILDTLGASVETAERLADGSADLGFMAANWVPRALRGESPFARPLALAAVAPMNAGPLFFIARADAPLRAVADLARKRIVFGAAKSGMAQHARLMLDLLGIEAAPLYLDFAAGAAAVESGAADAQLQCPIPNRLMTELDQRCALRVLPFAAGQIGRLLRAVPYYRRAVMAKGALRCLGRAVETVGVLNLLVAPEAADPAMVAQVARCIMRSVEELGR
ncbi:MAG: TAXI family TRAP transporter solute-binding subunit, partial [Stellaceae bacterium]